MTIGAIAPSDASARIRSRDPSSRAHLDSVLPSSGTIAECRGWAAGPQRGDSPGPQAVAHGLNVSQPPGHRHYLAAPDAPGGAASSPTGPSLRHLDLPDEPGLGEGITGLKLALQHRGHLLGPRARRDDLVS